MKRSAIIVSHGQPSDPEPAEADLHGFAQRVAAALPGWHVGAATLARPGALDTALAAAGPAPRIYPLFMTGGWFTGDALRERLSSAPGAVILPPLGVSPALPALGAELLRAEIAAAGWEASGVRAFIAGHGSGRSANSARDTRAFAAALGALLALAEIRVGFVEQSPFLADAARGLGGQSLCLPFFAAEGGHVVGDLPKALDAAGFVGLRLPPIGTAPAIPALVAREIAALG